VRREQVGHVEGVQAALAVILGVNLGPRLETVGVLIQNRDDRAT